MGLGGWAWVGGPEKTTVHRWDVEGTCWDQAVPWHLLLLLDDLRSIIVHLWDLSRAVPRIVPVRYSLMDTAFPHQQLPRAACSARPL